MRSSTHLSLSQFADLLGIDPWRFAQVNRGTALSQDRSCLCILQWSQSRQGRNDYIKGIRRAEAMFMQRTKVQPSPTCIENERSDGDLFLPRGALRSIKLKWNPVQRLGTCTYDALGNEVLDRDDLDEFVFTVTVPAGTRPDDVLVYFTPADAGQFYDVPAVEWQIRPLTVQITDTTATITGPSYLFVRPALQETDECLEHELATYVEDVDVYLRVVNPCQAGEVIFKKCQPCQEQRRGLCYTLRNSQWVVPDFAECVNGVYQRYCYEGMIVGAESSYIAGYDLMPNGEINPDVADVIFWLAIANMECDAGFCHCDTCSTSMWKRYRSVPKEVVSSNGGGGESYALLFDQKVMRGLRGRPPVLGNLLAFAAMQDQFSSVGGEII